MNHSPKALKARFPYMFEGKNISFDFYRGWMSILAQACEEIDHALGPDKRSFHWVQIKEKFGSARFYYHMTREPGEGARIVLNIHSVPNPAESVREVIKPEGEDPASVPAVVGDIIERATLETTTACIVCGATAQVRSYGGSYALLCDVHHPDQFPGGWAAIWRAAHAEDDDA